MIFCVILRCPLRAATTTREFCVDRWKGGQFRVRADCGACGDVASIMGREMERISRPGWKGLAFFLMGTRDGTERDGER